MSFDDPLLHVANSNELPPGLLAFGQPDKIFDEDVVPTDLMWLLLLDASSLLLKLGKQPIINRWGKQGATLPKHATRCISFEPKPLWSFMITLA